MHAYKNGHTHTHTHARTLTYIYTMPQPAVGGRPYLGEEGVYG